MYLLLLPLLFFGLSSGATGQTAKQAIDWIVATAENRAILNSELELRVKEMRDIISERQLPPLPEDQLRTEALERIIIEQLQLQMGERHGVVVSDEQLLVALERIADSQDTSVEKLQKKLQKEGVDLTRYRERLGNEIIIDEVQRGTMRSRIQVTNREVEQFLKSSIAEQITLGQYEILHIHFPFDPQDENPFTTQQVRKCIKILHTMLEEQGPQGIDSLREHKKCKPQYYDLGWLAFADVPSIFEEILPILKTHELSKAVTAGNGIHLAWLHDRRGGSQQIITQHKVKHILIVPSIVRPQENVHQELTTIRKRLLAGEDFSDLALDFSEDPGSKLKGGDLGWVSPGDTDPVFESVILETPVGDVSELFETQYGWHVLTVVEKREYNIAPEMARRQVRNILYGRKYDHELQNWLEKIRSEAHVEIR